MCGRPRGFKSFEENSDGRVDCDHVSGLLTRHHDRWPRWNPRSGPKQSSGLESHWFQRAFRIVNSTDRHLCQLLHPGIHAWLRWRSAVADYPTTRPRGPFGLAGRAIWLVNHGRNPVAVRSSEAPRDRARQLPVTPRPWCHLADCPGSASSHPAYSVRRFVSVLTASRQRWIRLRRSAGRRTRTTGAPFARAAR